TLNNCRCSMAHESGTPAIVVTRNAQACSADGSVPNGARRCVARSGGGLPTSYQTCEGGLWSTSSSCGTVANPWNPFWNEQLYCKLLNPSAMGAASADCFDYCDATNGSKEQGCTWPNQKRCGPDPKGWQRCEYNPDYHPDVLPAPLCLQWVNQ